jgi:hypothetical protein
MFNVDGRTDMTKLIAAFRNFANAPKSSTLFINSSLCGLVEFYKQFNHPCGKNISFCGTLSLLPMYKKHH